jgi:hypothetical protein
VEWLFRQMPKNEVERDVTQRSQFDTDDARIEATLVRESHQNSLDARLKSSNGPVKTRITIFTPADNESYFESLFTGLAPHLVESGVDLTEIDFRKPTFMLIEDFGTTGLTGNWDEWDKEPFTDFWRREGRSHKTGRSNGRWGLGKLVFSSASKIRTFFGLTIRHNDSGQPLLMGEAVLMTHNIGARKFVPYGFLANQDAEELQLPETDLTAIETFRSACGLTRTVESGLSVAVPFPLATLEPKSLVVGVLKNYFFPILTGQLVVDIQGTIINASTFEAVAAGCAEQVLSPELIAFIRKLDESQGKEPDIVLRDNWTSNMEAAIDPARVEALRSAFATNAVIHARAPIQLKRKNGVIENTFFDLFLQKSPDAALGDSLYIRSTITVPQESKYFNAPGAFGALLAKEEAIASFLGDAENPAHTQWNGSAEKLEEYWKAGRSRLSEIRASLKGLYKVLAQLEEQTEPDALIDFFSVEDLDAGKKPKPKKIVVKPVIPDLPPTLKAYDIAARKGGFALKAGKGLTSDTLPLNLKVRMAYDVLKGNPLTKYNPLDFRVDTSPITVVVKGATWSTSAPNSMDIEVTDIKFSVEVDGFDPNRDLLVEARKDGK